MFWAKRNTFECLRAKITLFSSVWFTNIIFFKPFDYNYDNFRILWIGIQYFSNMLSINEIRFRSVVKNRCFQMFSVQIRYFSHRLGRLSILMECFEAKLNTFQLFWVEIRYFSNVLDPRHILLNIFVYEYVTFWSFWVKRRHFPNMLGRISIHFELLWDKTRYFSNVLSRN